MFRDRADAGRQLARMLGAYATGPGKAPAVVVALPRGGVIVGAEVARELGADLEIVVVRKLGAPGHEELGIGAVVGGFGGQGAREAGQDGDAIVVLDEHLMSYLRVGREYLEGEIARQREEIRRREAAYRRGRAPTPLAGRVVIVVDDGIATGSTVRAALRAIRKGGGQEGGPARVVLAVPVGAPESLRSLSREADEAVCVAAPESFGAVGAFYQDFSQTTDEEVVRALDRAWTGASGGEGSKGEG